MFEGITPTPDRVFMKRLKAMDKKLDCLFFREHEHFVVTYDRACGMKAPLFMVKRDGGEFRQPDERDLQVLFDSDCSKSGESMTHRLNKMAYASEQFKNDKRAKASEAIRELTLDNKNQLVNATGKAHNLGKFNSTYRRVTPRSKGKVF